MFLLLIVLALNSCSENDNKKSPDFEQLHTKWTLMETTGTIAGIKHEFTNGTIIWEFNSNNTVSITNNNLNQNLQSGFPSGTYNYSINDNPLTASCIKNITIHLEEFGCIAIYDNQMDIVQGVADGINYRFEKITPFTTNK